MKQLKIISIVWGLLILAIFLVLTFFALKWKNETMPYFKLEDSLVSATKKYYESKYSYPNKDESKYVTYKELKENNVLESLNNGDDTCDGYVRVTLKGAVEYKAYIKCNKYKSKDYDKYINNINK